MEEVIKNLDVIIILIILIIYTIYKYKQYNFIKKKGLYYRDLIELNKKYVFHETRKKYYFSFRTTSKKATDRFDFNEAILYYIETNVDGIQENIEKIISNMNMIELYEEEYNKLIEKKYSYQENIVEGSNIKNVEKFKKLEEKLLKRKKIKYKCRFNVYARVDYYSPKGKNHWYKKEEYDCSEMLELYNNYLIRLEYKKSSDFQRKLVGASKRYEVLVRDNFTCQLCGATREDGAKLEVDHIKPISKGGKSDMDNLQTLCQACNRGKSNKF